jgi:TonB family protein
MKHPLFIAAAFTLALLAASWAPATEGPNSDRIVVDGPTRNQSVNEYVALTRDAIQRNWRNPLNLEAPEAVKGRVRIDYTVRRSGELDALTLVKGSGKPEMDRSLLEAIKSAHPFAPFPQGVNADRIQIRANFIVAETPTANVVTVSDSVGRKAPKPEPATQSYKKLLWGMPAGAARSEDDGAASVSSGEPTKPEKDSSRPSAPPVRKYDWGAAR